MRHAVLVARLLLGFVFAFFGLNFFFDWMQPDMEDLPEAAAAFLAALGETGFMHELRSLSEAVAGVMLISGICVPLGLLILAPIMVHIVGFHMYLDPRASAMGFTAVLCLMFVFLVIAYSRSWRSILEVVPRHNWSKRD